MLRTDGPSIEGIDRITYGVEDLDACRRFFADWGLHLVHEGGAGLDFESLNGCEVRIRRTDDPTLPAAVEKGSTLREVVWGVGGADDLDALRGALVQQAEVRESDGMLHCTDPNGIGIAFRVSRKWPVEIVGTPTHAWGHAARVDRPAAVYERAEPVEVGHVVFFTDSLAGTTRFYEALGFHLSDRYPGRGHFLRCAARGGHHDLFLLQTPEAKRGLNHVAFTVRDIHEVIGGGLQMARCGWETQLGPGRHPISSALFWYFKSPAGALVEYFADEDLLTENWTPRDFTPSPTMFAEWAKDLLLPWRTIVENVELGQEIQSVPAGERRRRALDLLAKCRLSDFVDHYPHQLSGGMRQRAALARTLAVDPSVAQRGDPMKRRQHPKVAGYVVQLMNLLQIDQAAA